MASWGLNSNIRAEGNIYHVQTSTIDSKNKIVCLLFKDGEVIDSKEMNYPPGIGSETLMALVRSIHQEKVLETESLFKISKRISSSSRAKANNKLGLVFLRNGMFDEAVSKFKRALELDSKYFEAKNNLGLAYSAKGLFDEAIQVFKEALSQNPQYPDLHNNLGQAYLKKGFPQEAIGEFQKAIEIKPDYDEAHFNLGLAYLESLKEGGGAGPSLSMLRGRVLGELELAAKLNPGFKNEDYELGCNYLQEGKLKEALQLLKVVKEKGRRQSELDICHDFYINFLYGERGLDEKEVKEYIKDLERILEKNPHYADGHNNLGIAYLIQCRFLFNRAIEEFRKSLDINPNYEEALRNLKLANNDIVGLYLLLRTMLK